MGSEVEGERERRGEESRRRGGGSNSSSEVISLIHSGRCANILLKISWQHTHTHTALMLELYSLCGPDNHTHTHTHTHPGQSPLKATGCTLCSVSVYPVDVMAPIRGSNFRSLARSVARGPVGLGWVGVLAGGGWLVWGY